MQETDQERNKDASRLSLTLGIISQLSGILTHSIRQYIEKGFVRMKTAVNVRSTPALVILWILRP